MIESFGPRPTVPSGPAASLPAVQAGEKIVHRPEKKVVPAERVDRTAQTGPRPAFQHNYLEQLAAYWPEEPEPPLCHVDYERGDEGTDRADGPADGEEGAPEPRAAEETAWGLSSEGAETSPIVDVRW